MSRPMPITITIKYGGQEIILEDADIIEASLSTKYWYNDLRGGLSDTPVVENFSGKYTAPKPVLMTGEFKLSYKKKPQFVEEETNDSLKAGLTDHTKALRQHNDK